jgi:hypothetical protein
LHGSLSTIGLSSASIAVTTGGGHRFREPSCGIVCGTGAPSTILMNVFAGIAPKRWTVPFGQRTSTESACVRVPSPKCSLASLLDR